MKFIALYQRIQSNPDMLRQTVCSSTTLLNHWKENQENTFRSTASSVHTHSSISTHTQKNLTGYALTFFIWKFLITWYSRAEIK